MTVFKDQISKYIEEINNLSLWLNMNTDLCVFTRNSGHVKTLTVRIASSKRDYKEIIEHFTFSYEGEEFRVCEVDMPPLEEAEACVKYLHKLVKKHQSKSRF